MFTILKKNNFILMGIVLLAVLCTQIFPYIHFHHTHENDKTNIISHFNHIENKQHHKEHDDNHHNEQEHLIRDWSYLKTFSCNNFNTVTHLQCITSKIFNDIHAFVSIVQNETKHPPPEEVSLSIDYSRGPPAILS
mgnify:CR=1 FL=1